MILTTLKSWTELMTLLMKCKTESHPKSLLSMNTKDSLKTVYLKPRDALRKMQEDSEKESKYNHKINIIIITIATLTLFATVIPIVISLFL